jgi:hypothetical protein
VKNAFAILLKVKKDSAGVDMKNGLYDFCTGKNVSTRANRLTRETAGVHTDWKGTPISFLY